MNEAPSPWVNPAEIRAALRQPLPTPVIVDVQAVRLPSQSLVELLKHPPTREELEAARRRDEKARTVPVRKTVAATTPSALPPSKHKPGDLLFVEYCKMKITFTLEYRKRENGERYLYHAEDHIRDQLKSQGDPNADKARMKAMKYSYVKWYTNE